MGGFESSKLDNRAPEAREPAQRRRHNRDGVEV